MTNDISVTDRLMAETAATVDRIAELSDELFRLSGQLWVIADWSSQRDIFTWSKMANAAGTKVNELQQSVPDVMNGITFTVPAGPLGDREVRDTQRALGNYHLLWVREPGS